MRTTTRRQPLVISRNEACYLILSFDHCMSCRGRKAHEHQTLLTASGCPVEARGRELFIYHEIVLLLVGFSPAISKSRCSYSSCPQFVYLSRGDSRYP